MTQNKLFATCLYPPRILQRCPHDQIVQVANLSVDPSHRRIGIGTNLIKHFLQHMQDKGFKEFGGIATANARKCFENCGMNMLGMIDT